MNRNIPMLSTIIWILFLNVVPSSGYCYYSSYSNGYYYCYNLTYLSVGSIIGAVVGSIFGIIVLVVIVCVICSQIKTRGVRGTVVNPTNVSTVQQQQPSAPPTGNYNYSQYPPPSGSVYPPPSGSVYPPPSGSVYPPPGGSVYPPPPDQNYGQPPVYTGTPMKH